MISFKDKTWCDAQECGRFGTCIHAYTPQEKERAVKWWGQPNPPVGFYLNPQALKCYAPTQPERADAISEPRGE